MKKGTFLPPFKRLCVTIGNLPASYVDSMSYYECLMWLCKYLQETVIPAINNNAEAVNEIEHWIETLDLQDEVDNKLDKMAESGVLQEIMADYLNSKAIFGFDNVASMKTSTNLIDGSYARTLGYYSSNDGGAGLYKIRTITNEDTIDEGSIIAMEDDTLVAELVVLNNTINAKQFGAKGDGTTNDTTAFRNMLKAYGDSNIKIELPKANSYLIGGVIDLYSNTEIDMKNQKISLLEGTYFYNATFDTVEELKNVYIHDGTFDGYDESLYSTTLKFGLIHADNVKVEKVKFEKCINNDHVFDLAGCDNVTIKDCIFHNGIIANNEERCEVIQIDVATYSSAPYWNESSLIYDGKSCSNISILNNTFTQDNKTNGKLNAIGTHNNIADKIHSNILVDHNIFDEPSYANINISRWTNFTISNNTFNNGINVTDNSTNIFINNGIVDLGSNQFNFIPYDNVKIENNFFNNADKRNNGIRAIYIQGGKKNETYYYHKNIIISNNISNGSYDRVNNLNGNDFLSISYLENVLVDSNIVNNAKNFIYAQNNNINVTVTNNKLNECRTIDSASTNITNPLWVNNTSLSNNNLTLYNKSKYSYYDATNIVLNSGWSISSDWEHCITRDGNVVTLNFQLVHDGNIASDNNEITVGSGVIPSEYRPPVNARYMISAIVNNGYSIGGVAVMQTGSNGNIQIRNNSGIATNRFGVNITYQIH